MHRKKEVIIMAEEYLTKEQRKKYLAELNQEQREVLNKYKKYKINSGLLTQVNQDGVFWQLQEELVNENYDFHNPKESPLVCSCGKHVKYLYICKASDSDQIKKFGRNHLQQEAGIPAKVITQVNKLHHEIDRGTDIIISQYHEGTRFPQEDYQTAMEHDLLNDLDSKKKSMFQEFEEVNLPLYFDDAEILQNTVERYEAEQRWIAYQKKMKEEEEQRQREEKEREEEEKRQQALREQAEQLQSKQKELQLNGLNDTWQKVFKGNEDLIKQYFLKYFHYKLTCYIMFNEGEFEKGSVIHSPSETKQLAFDFLDENPDIEEELDKQDPHLIKKLAFAKDSKLLFKILLSRNVISFDDNGQLIYIGNAE